ncbi:GNAT family N-acetyltransferase [Cellulomonas oligotrophica]|uniref:N-acetyltransferase n=1 Tax=Cellulomonas oligotrophica TaxID=931536 RepID=A0ABQ4DFB2_9CELL|nr:N-acetyltransferase [Cellulomonas oligotrophica]
MDPLSLHHGAVDDSITLHVRGDLTDRELDLLHSAAFDQPPAGAPWRQRLADRSLTWVTARLDDRLVGFVNVVGDGGVHAILLDTCVAAAVRGRGVGRALVGAAADEARRAGCHWLHADYEPHLADFYEGACGLRPTDAGLLRLV